MSHSDNTKMATKINDQLRFFFALLSPTVNYNVSIGQMQSSDFFFRAHTSNHLKSNRKQNGNLFASLVQTTSCATAFCLQITINTLTFTLSPK